MYRKGRLESFDPDAPLQYVSIPAGYETEGYILRVLKYVSYLELQQLTPKQFFEILRVSDLASYIDRTATAMARARNG